MTQNGASFGTYLKEKRNERGITLRGLALELNLSAPYLSDMENDRRNPPEMEKLQRICDILGLSQKEKIRLFDLVCFVKNFCT